MSLRGSLIGLNNNVNKLQQRCLKVNKTNIEKNEENETKKESIINIIKNTTLIRKPELLKNHPSLDFCKIKADLGNIFTREKLLNPIIINKNKNNNYRCKNIKTQSHYINLSDNLENKETSNDSKIDNNNNTNKVAKTTPQSSIISHTNSRPLNIVFNKNELETPLYFDLNLINKDIVKNPQIPIEYINIIYHNLLKEEKGNIIPKVDWNYMRRQKEITEQMRSILFDWIIDVHYKFKFTDETLFMTQDIIDRYLSINQISKDKFQLLGITAMLIACKHEEINLPKIDDFIYITDNAYSRNEVIYMEYKILNDLKFSLLRPSANKFYDYMAIKFNFNEEQYYMGKYIMEYFIVDINYIKYTASVISCACTYIVLKFFKFENYHDVYDIKYYNFIDDENKYNQQFSENDVKDCARDICFFVDNAHKTKFLSCWKKYSQKEFKNIASFIIEKKNK